MATVDTKKVKVTSRGFINTSRGRVLAPTGLFYESPNQILKIILQDKATVMEQLKDGSLLELNITNFDKDNNKPIDENIENEPVIDETSVEVKDVTEDVKKVAAEDEKVMEKAHLSRSQRKALRRKEAAEKEMKRIEKENAKIAKANAIAEEASKVVKGSIPKPEVKEEPKTDSELETTEVPDTAMEV